MGFVQSVFGSDEQESAESKYAVMINAGPDQSATASNGFEYAVDLSDRGYDVQVYLDGEGTKWPAAFAEDPDRPFKHRWDQLQERGLLAGACGYCASAFGATEACRLEDVDLLSGGEEHAPAVGELADEGYELLTIG